MKEEMEEEGWWGTFCVCEENSLVYKKMNGR